MVSRSKRPTGGDESFEAVGGAAELAGVGLDGLEHLGPLALVVGLIAAVMAPVLWLLRRRSRV
jgi:hypothetical protein